MSKRTKKKFITAVPLFLAGSLLFSSANIVSAYNYTSYQGLQIADQARIPAESRTSDADKKMDVLIGKLKDPKLILANLPTEEVHPSLWFRDSELPDFQKRRHIKDSYYEKLWAKIQSDVEQYSQYDYTDAKLHENNRSRGAKLLAFYYIMIKDDPSINTGKKDMILRKAKEAAVFMYTGTVEERTKDDGDIYWATYLQDYAATYDWLYPFFTEKEEKQARSRLKKEAQFIAEWLAAPQPPRPHNHRSKPALGLGTVALTLSKEPEAQYWLNLAIERTNNVFEYQFSTDGISREGAHYGQFTLVNLIPFLWNYRNVSGTQGDQTVSPEVLIQKSQPIFEWAVKTRMGNGWLPNTEDSYVKPYATHMAAGLYKNTDAPHYGNGMKLSEALQWSYANTHIYLADYTGATSQYQIAIDEYLTYDASVQAKQPTSSRTMFMNGGINPVTKQPYGGNAILGNQWNAKTETDGDKTLWLMFNGTPESDNHQHQDQLHFNIYGHNALFATDTGYGQYSAFNSYLKTPQAHNVITLNGRSVRNESDPYQSLESKYEMDTPFFDFAQKEGSYYDDESKVIGSHKRAIAFPGQQYFVVADQAQSTNGKADWSMSLHSLGALRLEGTHAQWQITKEATPELTKKPEAELESTVPFYDLNEAKMETYIFPTSQTVQSKNGVMSLFKEDLPDTYLEAKTSSDKTRFLTVLVPQGLKEQAPKVQDLSTNEFTAARVELNGNTDTYLLQDSSGKKSIAGHLQSDGTFAWARETGSSTTGVMMREGSQLTVSGTDLLRSDAPMTVALQTAANLWTIEVTDPGKASRLSLMLPEGLTAAGLSLNGQSGAAFETKGLTVEIPVKQAGTYELAIQGIGKSLSNSAPTADFKVDAQSGYGVRDKGTRTIQVDASASKGDDLTYNWNFGDGTTSDKKSVIKELKAFGTYLVNLTVTDNKGRIDSKTVVVENLDPNHAPEAKFTSDVNSGRPPLTVHFDASESFDPDEKDGDRVVKYKWDFGDKTPVIEGTSQQKVEHLFNKVGSFPVTLTVSDTSGKAAVYSEIIEVGSLYGYLNVDLANPEDEDVYVLFEAEDFTYNSSQGEGQISLEEDGASSSGKYVKIGSKVPDSTKDSVLNPAWKDTLPADKIPNGTPYVEYEFKVKHPGSYQVHLYSKGTSASNGSVFIQFDSSDLTRVTLKDNDWKRAYDNTQFILSEGTHVLRVYSRKGGADWDRVLLMTDGTTHTKVQSTIIPKIEQSYPVEPPQN
ncbi:PKD repeat-containing protein [Paenibacillus sp. 1_12]|uniref:PKD domain-containing protein n=1 Tax=Paenibacillus sp. 1_12 TaxID=1566278 RepID=UPI0008E0B45C|nr:PKD domain-containing protein [Paenibacillus sp. 1_12]SFM44992.1 PKD repeat-containing protein [Paenibacillus sp. 1_12]